MKLLKIVFFEDGKSNKPVLSVELDPKWIYINESIVMKLIDELKENPSRYRIEISGSFVFNERCISALNSFSILMESMRVEVDSAACLGFIVSLLSKEGILQKAEEEKTFDGDIDIFNPD